MKAVIFPADVDGLKAIVFDLRKREKQLAQEKRQVENDFGKKRAMLKGMFISKEGMYLMNTFFKH